MQSHTFERGAEPLREAGESGAAVRTDRSRLLQLRWISVGVMSVMAVLVFPLLAPGHPLAPLLGVALALAGVNLALLAGVARRLDGGRGAIVQLGLDLLAWSTYLYFAGGVTNPAISLLLPLVAVGAAVLPARQAWILALLAITAYSLLWQFHHPVKIPDASMAMHWHLAGMWFSFVISALTVVWFVARLNAALSHRERALAASNAARARDAYVVGLGKLAAGAAHRLGTPLGTLRILVDELSRRTDLEAEVRDDLELMRTQVDHCRDILNSLTREAGQQRAQGGGAETAVRWLDAVVARWRALRPHVAAELRCGAEVGERRIVVDESLGEALHNLIDNAANANARAGQGGVAVEIEASMRDRMLVVEVLDRGSGMAAEPAASPTPMPLESGAADTRGMGVGLLLARSAVEHHDGKLELVPRAGGGTVARIAIPVEDTRS